MFKIKKGEKDLLLTPYTLKTNKMDKKSGMTHQNVRESFETVGTGVRVVRPIAVPVINGITVADERNQSVGMGESSAPYDTSDPIKLKGGRVLKHLLDVDVCSFHVAQFCSHYILVNIKDL